MKWCIGGHGVVEPGWSVRCEGDYLVARHFVTHLPHNLRRFGMRTGNDQAACSSVGVMILS